VERRQVVGMWVGGTVAAVGSMAILGMLTDYKDKSDAISVLIMAGLMIGLGGRSWWNNNRRLKSTRRALLFLTQPCQSTLHLNVLTVQLQQLTIDVPLKDKVSSALAQSALPAAGR
jgi:drug/metabolite transporter (DMT)-like permease